MSRSTVAKQNFQAAREVIPILEGSCARLKRLLGLCDRQIDLIEQDSSMSGRVKGKEFHDLVRIMLNLQKDLLKYTQALYPDIPATQKSQSSEKLRKEDLEALSDSQLQELMGYMVQDEGQEEVNLQEIVDTMLNRSYTKIDANEGRKETEKAPSSQILVKVDIPNESAAKQKSSAVRLHVQSVGSRQPKSKQATKKTTAYGLSSDRIKRNPDNRKYKPPSGPRDDPNAE